MSLSILRRVRSNVDTETTQESAIASRTAAAEGTAANNAIMTTRLLVENTRLKRAVESQRKKAIKQHRTILDLRKENTKFKKKISLRISYSTSFRNTGLQVK